MTSPLSPLTAIGYLKNALRHQLPGIKSSHLSEAVASGLGFRTHASLLAHVKAGSSLLVNRFDGRLFVTRFEQLGYTCGNGEVTSALDVVPEGFAQAVPSVLRLRERG